MPRQNDVETSVERVDPLVGTIFDKRFRVEERIAAGGFGAIYRATHVKSGHQIALKVLLPSLAQDLGVVARFRREGDTLTALRSPHTITAYELGQAGDRTLFIVMELLYGESLFERYKANGPFDWKRMVRIARQVCESLEEAHARGVVHRDLKPTNIHLERHGDDPDYVKVLDFGIAKILGGGGFDPADLTNAGQMVGTIDYMSPEQMVGGKVTGQSDIYTLGIVMYEMIAGCTPYPEAMTAAQALAAIMKTPPEALYLRAPVPEALDRIVMRCLERDMAKRYPTVAELRADLERLLAGIGDPARGIDTKPVDKQDDEATTFTPPPEQVLVASRRAKRPSVEQTTFTPPPERLVAESRRAKRPSVEQTTFTPPPEPLLAQSRGEDWSSAEQTAFTPPPEPLLAQSRRAKRPSVEPTTFTPPPEPLLAQSRRAKRPSVEPTTFTPPPQQILDDLRTPPRAASAVDEWTEDDEYAPTTSRRPEGAPPPRAAGSPHSSEEHERETTVARLSDIAARAAMSARPDPSERAATVPRDAGDRAANARDAADRAATVPASREVAARGMPPARDVADRAVTVPASREVAARGMPPARDAADRAVTVPADRELAARSLPLPRDASERAVTIPAPRELAARSMPPPRDEGERATVPILRVDAARGVRGAELDDGATAPRRAAPPRSEDSNVDVLTPPFSAVDEATLGVVRPSYTDDSGALLTPPYADDSGGALVTPPFERADPVTPGPATQPLPRRPDSAPAARRPDSAPVARKPDSVARKPDSVARKPDSVARKPDSVPPPIPPTPRKPPTAPPPIPPVAARPPSNPPPVRPGSRTAPPPSTLIPPREVAGVIPTPQPRPLARAETPIPQLVVAPFSQPPPAAAPAIITPVPSAQPNRSAYVPTPLPQSPPVPQPYVAPPPAAAPFYPTMPGPTPVQAPRSAAAGGRSYDMSRMAAREAVIRRLIWIVVLVVAGGVGIILATRL